jgi:AcrR family transcriptional regulator
MAAVASVNIDRPPMADETRPYTMKRRAEQQEQTRRRIAESAAELHEVLGPARTSISAIAERAGVRRSTVYRHFPDEESLFIACTSQWMASNAPPDIAAWGAITDPDERLHAALLELYGHYGRTQRMMENILRDEETMPIVKQMFTGFRDYLEGARKTLMAGRGHRGRARRRVSAAIGHALHFNTWDSLVREQGLDDFEAAELMCRLVADAR